MGGTKKRGEQTKILKRGQAGFRGGALKRGAGTPLPTMSIINRKTWRERQKKAWSWKCDETLFGMEEFAEAVIHKC